ncbi:PPR domain-containing protein/PPR_3 domain-containing protein [Cephalotus follicularis]|uniref:PPR domain-containing protein/PPR_3 domain-containing protein n=1 Tax=Cephalotus follicularis TaxID=3775 RepID=A0A1Q3DCV7_CEPFO|nr:PPR domain-containing protein/PPR_3 domain-containing protein [Cephalotus follicularis]
MDSLCIPISHDIYASLVKECTIAGDSHRARELHDHIKDSHIKPTLPLLNRLLLMHVSCGRIHPARNLFDVMPLKDRNSWAIMIVGYVNIDDYEEAINLFVQMQGERQCSPMLEFPAWIIVLVLKACVLTGNMGLGKQVHGFLLKLGGVNDSSSTASSLINFYGKFRCLDDATFVFDQMLCRDTVIWTARIVNSCREGHFHEVINDFLGMGRQGIKWNSFTFSSVLKACAGINDGGECGRQVHANAIKLGIESDVFVQCGLIDMYRKCVLLIDAKRVFEMISHKRNPACWNAMLMGYLHNGFYVEAIKFLYKMKTAGMEVQESLVNEVRIVCGSKIHENSIECNN